MERHALTIERDQLARGLGIRRTRTWVAGSIQLWDITGFAFVWARVTRTTPPFALAPRSGALLAIVSSALGLWAILTLGQQWSVQERLRTDHRLVTAGPYGWVSHPVYTAFVGLLIATGLVFAPSVSRLLIGIVLYLVGTAFRIRSEDSLLHERFGKTFDDYARRTPALIRPAETVDHW